MSPWPAASKRSNTLRECSVMCVEPALENIGWTGGSATRLNGATTQIHEQSLFRFGNSSGLADTEITSQISASSSLYHALGFSACDLHLLCSRPIQCS